MYGPHGARSQPTPRPVTPPHAHPVVPPQDTGPLAAMGEALAALPGQLSDPALRARVERMHAAHQQFMASGVPSHAAHRPASPGTSASRGRAPWPPPPGHGVSAPAAALRGSRTFRPGRTTPPPPPPAAAAAGGVPPVRASFAQEKAAFEEKMQAFYAHLGNTSLSRALTQHGHKTTRAAEQLAQMQTDWESIGRSLGRMTDAALDIDQRNYAAQMAQECSVMARDLTQLVAQYAELPSNAISRDLRAAGEASAATLAGFRGRLAAVVQDAREGAALVRGDVREVRAAVVADVREAAREVRAGVRDVAADVREGARELRHDAREAAHEMRSDLRAVGHAVRVGLDAAADDLAAGLSPAHLPSAPPPAGPTPPRRPTKADLPFWKRILPQSTAGKVVLAICATFGVAVIVGALLALKAPLLVPALAAAAAIIGLAAVIAIIVAIPAGIVVWCVWNYFSDPGEELDFAVDIGRERTRRERFKDFFTGGRSGGLRVDGGAGGLRIAGGSNTLGIRGRVDIR